MNVKKKLTALAVGATLLLGSAFAYAGDVAWMTKGDVRLGNIEPGQSLDYVASVYGPLGKAPTHYNKNAVGYNNTVKIIPTADGQRVKSILVEANNGWATPAGVTVGMDVATVEKIYGDGSTNPTHHRGHRMKGFDYYTYFPASDKTVYLTFAAKNGKVAYIKVGSMKR